MIIETLEQRIEAARKLLRIKEESMTPDELDLAAALLLRKPIRLQESLPGTPEIQEDGTWRNFSPTRNWDDYGMLASQTEIVVGTHPIYADISEGSEDEAVSGYSFSCHSFFSGTEANGTDLRETVCRCCALRLSHDVEFGKYWGHD